jgi:hypothetical protein
MLAPTMTSAAITALSPSEGGPTSLDSVLTRVRTQAITLVAWLKS